MPRRELGDASLLAETSTGSGLGKDQADILADAKGAQWKAQIALALSHHTTASTGWIADQLNMGTPGHVRKILSNSTA